MSYEEEAKSRRRAARNLALGTLGVGGIGALASGNPAWLGYGAAGAAAYNLLTEGRVLGGKTMKRRKPVPKKKSRKTKSRRASKSKKSRK